MKKIVLRRADKKDCRDLWAWRNHPEVRKWHFNAKIIEYKIHVKWFEGKIGSDNACIYIAENQKKEKTGQIRMEVGADRIAYVTIDLNPEFFGRGLGSKIIKMGTEVFMGENPRIRGMAAEICSENIASQKAFEKAGYAFSHNDLKKDRRIVVYRFKKTGQGNF